MPKDAVIFIGAERVGKAVLEALLNAGKNIVAVFTADASLRYKIADYIDFYDLEKKYPRIDFNYIRDNNEPSVTEKIKKYKPEVIFVISWSQMIPTEILKIPAKGVVGLHYSLLPERRGGAPLNWAIIEGLKESGISLFYIDEGIDCGDIIGQRKFLIDNEDTINDLLEKITIIAPSLILEYYDLIVKGEALRIKQNKLKVTYTPKRTPRESEIDFSWGLKKIHNFIRALAPPYPSAFVKINNKRVVFISAKMTKNKQLKIDGYIEENA